MTEFLFIRHGETDANKNGKLAGKKDDPLNEKGIRQAQRAAQSLKGQCADAVYCGNARRVNQTFELIRDALVFDPQRLFFTDDIREMNMGDWEGRDFKLVARENPDDWAKYMQKWTEFPFPGGESPKEYFEHCAVFIKGLAKRHKGQRVVLFGHKGFILACACVLGKKPIERLFDRDIKTGAYFLMNCDE